LKQPVTLHDAIKNYTFDQDKICSPEETVNNFRAKLREINLDLLEETVRIDNGRLDIPVYFSVCGKDAYSVIGTKKQMGKGGTPAQSEASAVMELAERFSFFSFFKNPTNFVIEEQRNLKKKSLPSDAIALSVHDESDDLDKAMNFFSTLPLRWTWGYNLTREEEVLIPFDWFYAINEFNGPSAGNCIEEALSQGICEVVERDVSSRISRERIPTPAIRLESVTDSLTVEMINKYRKSGIKLFATDFSLDMGIPSVGVLAYDPATFPERSEIVWTAGTTPNPQKSLSRALTEVAQLAGDFNSGANYVASGLPKFTRLEETHFVTSNQQQANITHLPDLSHDNIKTEVERMIAALAKKTLDVLVIDTMHPQLQIPAFYTIVPGAHFRERAAGTSVGLFTAKLIAEGEDKARAVSELKKMDRLMPGKYYVKFYLGTLSLAMGNPPEALRLLDESLDLDPEGEDKASVYSYMGQCLKEMGQYEEALSALEKGARCDDDRTDIHNLMGFCHYKMKDHEKAIDCFRKVLQLDPSSAIDYANIASNYRDMGQKEKAIHFYTIALEMDPTIDFARENLMKLVGQSA
jgi:ribosomal protein S12 methylthiotransferase accessory factor